jgi:PAS domain S-box-containing protein
MMMVLMKMLLNTWQTKLEDAIFQKVGAKQPPAAGKILADDALKGAYDSRLVRIEGTLIDRIHFGQETFLVLQADGFIFNAYLEHKSGGLSFAYIENGSRIAVRGICLIDPGDDWHVGPDWRAKSFRILMRHPGDIEVLQRPPWWNLRKLLWTVAALGGLIMMSLIWVFVLRRRVSQQTKIIRQKLEAEEALKNRYEALFENANDMVFTLNHEGFFTAVNSTGEQLLQRFRTEIVGVRFIDFVAEEQRSTANLWLEQIFQKDETSPAELELVNRDGQRFRMEISTRLVRKGGSVETEGIGRDITERNRLEKEILEISTREQRRIGHDLHDGVCQQLAGIAYRLDMLGDDLAEQGKKESTEAERIGLLINEAVNQTRSVARGLFPVRLETEGLVSTLEELAANSEDFFKLTCRFVC